MKKVAVYGYGYVGKAAYELLKDEYELIVKDPGLGMNPSEAELTEAELAVVCVPTPSLADGSCDTSIVAETVRTIPQQFVLIKSTVEPGTTNRLVQETGKHIVFSPEYVSESTYPNPYYKNMADTSFVVLGGPAAGRRKAIEYLQPVYGPMVQYFQCGAIEAELIKYMANVYSAMKVTFVNEMYDLSKRIGADWHLAREGWLLDKRIEPMSTMVFADKRGYSGKCLPKDTLALARFAQRLDLELGLLNSIHNHNLYYAHDRLAEHIPLDSYLDSPHATQAGHPSSAQLLYTYDQR